MTKPAWPTVAELIPHSNKAVLIDRILTHDAPAQHTTVRVVAGAQNSLRRADHSVPAWIAIEYMAQAIAAHEGLIAWVEGRELPVGFLISASKLELRIGNFEAGEILHIASRHVRGRIGLGVLSHQCAVFREREGDAATPVAEGRLSIAIDPTRTWSDLSGVSASDESSG